MTYGATLYRAVLALFVLGLGLPGDLRAADEPYVAVAVDVSTSMRGFSASGIVERTLLSLAPAMAETRSLSGRSGAVPSKRYYAVAADVSPLASIEPLLSANSSLFGKERADLARALLSDQLTHGRIAVLLTDGQPSATSSELTAPCVPGERPNFSALVEPIRRLRDTEHRPLWLILERAPFVGEIFLNCGSVSASLQSIAGAKVQCDPPKSRPKKIGPAEKLEKAECHVRYDGARTLVAFFIGAPDAAEPLRELVEAYGRRRQASGTSVIAIDLAGNPPRWTLRAPEVSERRLASVTTTIEDGTPVATVRCHERSERRPVEPSSATIRLSATRPASPDDMLSLQGIGDPEAAMVRDEDGRVRLLDDNIAFDRALLRKPGAPRDWAGPCPQVWERYDHYWRIEHGTTDAAHDCAAPTDTAVGQTVWCRDVVALCDCGRARTGTALVHLKTSIVSRTEEVLATLRSRQFAVDDGEAWLAHPDRVEGLGELIRAIERPDDTSIPIGAFRINVVPPGTTAGTP